ncbi:DUF5808 domain-containing protein [Planococcus sp. N064]|uniref:DUF5808 domain-containing protein n=1 Tax=Planococcus liqunii TaxID=3058394 RepID=A0ABT8MSI4_9BACL|nr:DUF5808 domain-containing protein [Planococcus sp. N064]MDN7227681.1 DUF5808 domain-containing protein [Planococcus sp. N064]
MTVFLMAVIMLLVIGAQAFVPFFVRKTEVFGIYVPLEYSQQELLQNLKKNYTIQVLLVGGAIVGLYAIGFGATETSEETAALWGVGLQLALIVFSMVLYLRNHVKVKKEKQKQGWTKGKKEKVVVDLQFRNDLEMVSNAAFLLPVIITFGLILYTLSHYGSLPAQIPVHWGPDGPDRYTEKTVFTSISLMLVLLVMQILFFALNWARKTSGAKIRASQKLQSRERELASRKYGSWLLLISAIASTLLMGSLQLSIIHAGLGTALGYMALIVGFLIVVLGGTAFYAFKMVKSSSFAEEELADPGVIDADSDEHWKAGIFYVNKEDPSVMAEKRFGIGWTINFGNPKSWLYLLLPVAVLLLIAFLL